MPRWWVAGDSGTRYAVVVRVMLRSTGRVLFLLTAFVIVGCSSRENVTIHLEGVVSYEGYRSGQVLIAVYEDVSYYPQPLGQWMAKTPGEKRAEMVINAPGSFHISAEIRNVGGTVPGVLILVYLYDGDLTQENNIAGAIVSLTAEDHADIHVSLSEGFYPVLL